MACVNHVVKMLFRSSLLSDGKIISREFRVSRLVIICFVQVCFHASNAAFQMHYFMKTVFAKKYL